MMMLQYQRIKGDLGRCGDPPGWAAVQPVGQAGGRQMVQRSAYARLPDAQRFGDLRHLLLGV
nr:hypothetical protein [Actinomadura rubteroloni]